MARKKGLFCITQCENKMYILIAIKIWAPYQPYNLQEWLRNSKPVLFWKNRIRFWYWKTKPLWWCFFSYKEMITAVLLFLLLVFFTSFLTRIQFAFQIWTKNVCVAQYSFEKVSIREVKKSWCRKDILKKIFS